jgi:hypothetical protein
MRMVREQGRERAGLNARHATPRPVRQRAAATAATQARDATASAATHARNKLTAGQSALQPARTDVEAVLARVEQREAKHAVQHGGHRRAVVLPQVADDLRRLV